MRKIVIVGGGAAAGAVASAMAVSLQGSGIGITLVLSPNEQSPHSLEVSQGGPLGFHAKLGIEESALCQHAGAVHGMGTRYRGLFRSAEAAFVPQGTHGTTLRLVDFHHYVAKLRVEGDAQDFNDWSIAAAAAEKGRFVPAQTGVEPALRLLEYDLYVDHDAYLAAMLKHASNLDVKIVEQKPLNVHLNGAGMLEHLTLDDQSKLHGDLFIDCSEEGALIRNVANDDEFQDWSSWLSCDRAVSLTGKSQTTPDLFTSFEADDAGWLTKFSTSRGTAGTFVYDSSLSNDTAVIEKLAVFLPGANSDDAHATHFRAGRYTRHWDKNCVAIGPAAAVLAPMEASPLKLAQSSILRLLAMLPRHKDSPVLATEFNRTTNAAIDSARDYQLLRLALADCQTGQFWQSMQQVQWPDSLHHRIELFRSRGRFTAQDNEFFTKSNWISSFINSGLWPASYDPLADMIDEQRMRADLARFKKNVRSGT